MIYPMLLPPDLFPLEMQPLIYFVLLPLACLVMFIVPLVLFFFVFPPEARLYVFNKFQKKPMIDYETEDGTRHLETAKIYPEGFLIGDKSKNIYLLPRPTQRNVIAAELQELLKGDGTKYTEDDIEEIYDTLNKLEKRTLSAGIVKGLGVRIFRAYQSLGLATTLAQLVGLSYVGEDSTAYMAVPIVAKSSKKMGQVLKPSELVLHENKKLKEWYVNVLLPVIPSIAQKFFNKNYTQNQLIALKNWAIEYGKAQASNPLGKWFIYILIAVIIIGGIALLALLVFGGG